MGLSDDRIKKLLAYRYDPGTTSPSPNLRHREAYRDKEFDDGVLAEFFHENTKLTAHGNRTDRSSVEFFVSDETMQFVQNERRNDYPGREPIDLPSPETDLDVGLGTALQGRRSVRRFDGTPIDRQGIATVLGLAFGVNGRLTSEVGAKLVRTYPSGGGLYPVEIYPVVLNGSDGLEEGLYYYVTEEHCLRKLDDDLTATVEEAFQPPGGVDLTEAAVCLLFTASFWRTYAKYGSRGYRFVLQESGHMCQNAQLVAGALGFGSFPIGAVYEDRIEDALEINGVDESLVYSMFLGGPLTQPTVPGVSHPGGSEVGGGANG